MERKLKKPVIYSLTAGLFVIVIGAFFFMDTTDDNYNYDEDYEYVSKLFDNEPSAPVAKTTETLIKPFTNENIKVLKNFYDYQGKEEEQQNAIINYEQTYIQNNGVAYGGEEKFDVVSAFSGTVLNVKEDKLQGNIVNIEHENGIISTYKSLSEVNVKENAKVTQGMVIGKSGTSNINKDLGDHIVFEITSDSVYINPEKFYGKDINSLKNN